MSHWSFAASASVVLLAVSVCAWAAWISWANWHRNGRRKLAGFLEATRFVLITLLCLTLLRPEYVEQMQRTLAPEVVILGDSSGSMATRDIQSGSNVTSRAEWWEKQKQAAFWKPLEKTVRVSVEEFSAAATNQAPAASGTDLDAALDGVLRRDRNLKAVVLLSDGDWNIGKSPVGTATRYRDQSIPVFTVSVGRESPLPDLILEPVAAPSYGLFGEQVSIPFRITSRLPREVKTTISLLDPKQEEIKRELVIPPLGEVQDAISWSPRTVGENTLTLKLPVEKEETLTDNNEQTFRISARVETLKALIVDSLPRWEYRFLRNALARDPGVEMHCILFHPGMASGSGKHYLPSFPGTKEQLSQYDVIFLGDVGIGSNELQPRDAELIRGLVEHQSSGLVFIPGRRGRQTTFRDTPLEELMPVALDAARPEGVLLQNESELHLSSLGKGHLLTRFDSNEDRNDEIWKLLPGFFWSAAVEKSKPGVDVLGVHASLRNNWGRLPMLATRSFGSGKVLFLGTDSAWRWRRGVEDKYHYRFWSQVVRWMSHQRHLAEKQGIRLSYSPETPGIHDTVFLQATVLDASGYPASDGAVVATVTAPSGKTERLEFSMTDGGWGVFKSTFTPQEGGPHRIQVAAAKHGRDLAAQIEVTQPVIEKIGQPANAGILREIASITHGAYAGHDSLSSVMEQISLLPEPKPIERRMRVWASPWWGGFLLLLLGIYWTGRKVAGMV